MSKELIEHLRKFDTATLSDALDSMRINGGLEGIIAQSSNKDICGCAFTVKYTNPNEEDRIIAKAADFIDEVESGEVVILANNSREDCTVWGGILTTIANKKGICGTIIDGACRDIDVIDKIQYPLFSKSVFMKTGKGRTKKIAHQVPVRIGDIEIFPGDYIRGDRNGVIVIPKNLIEEIIYRAEIIAETENKILEAVSQGMRLEEARKIYRYHRPWEIVTEAE